MEAEFTVVSDRREGLLGTLGSLVIQNGFSLLRQKISVSENGVQLWMRVSGSEDSILALEDQISAHPMVVSFESDRKLDPKNPGAKAFVGKSLGVSSHLLDSQVKEIPVSTPAIGIVEAELIEMSREYPRIFPRVLNLRGKIPASQVASSMEFAGRRLGSWVYKRDPLRKENLNIDVALQSIAKPVLTDLLPVDIKNRRVRLLKNPLCTPEHGSFGCDFFLWVCTGSFAGFCCGWAGGGERCDVSM